jgi:hypothetical protein
MAYLAATVLDSYRAQYAGFDNYEHRASRYGCLSAFMADTPNLLNADEIVKAKQAQAHATTIPVINRKTFSTGSSRTCDVQSGSNVSAFVTLSWTTITVGFHMVPSQYSNNYVKYQDDFGRKMRDAQIALGSALDTAAYTYLNTNKAQTNNSEFYTVTSNVMQVPYADRVVLFNNLEGVMGSNDLYGPFNVVCSTQMSSMIRELSNQGSTNGTNYAYQFMGYNMYYSNRCTVADGDFGTVFCMPIGSLGFMAWIDPASRAGEQNGYQEWGIIPLPDLGIEAGLFYQASCADNTTEAGTGYDATLKESFLISFDYCFIYAYNSSPTTLPGTIYKAAIAKT